MDNDTQRESNSTAFQVWLGQWRLSTLEAEGCMFVLRFLLRAFSTRRPDDRFWKFLRQFFFAEEKYKDSENDYYTRSAKELIGQAGTLTPEEARALLAYLSECYAADPDRLFWGSVSEAMQLHNVAPYSGRSAGTA